MSLLYTELKNIYNKKAYLNRTSPLEEFHVSFKTFLINELKKQTKYYNPYKFAMTYAINPREALNIFLALSGDNKVLKQYFAVECECGGVRIVESLDPITLCDECHEEIVYSDDSFLQNITLLFKLEEKIKKELQFDLKPRSSSVDESYVKEGEFLKNPSIQDILTNRPEDEALEEVEGMKKFAEKIRTKLIRGTQ